MKINLSVEPARPRPAQAGLFLPPFPEPEKLELTLARIADMVGEGNVGSVELDNTHRPESFRVQHFSPEKLNEPKSSSNKAGGPAAEFNGKNSKEKSEANNARETSQPSFRTSLSSANLATNEDFESFDINQMSTKTQTALLEIDSTEHKEAPITVLRMFRPPFRAEVASREGTPVRMTCPKNKTLSGEIIWAAGPWRSAGDWWEQEGWSRDEWDIMLQTAAGIALYRLVRDHFSNCWLLEGSYD